MVETVHTCDVLVVGAGPAGLTAAGDLARAGRSVVVLEKWPAPNPTSRAFATMARTLELLDARGLASGLIARGAPTKKVNLFNGAALHMSELPSRFQFALIAPQTEVDAALAAYADEEGAQIHRGMEVVRLDQDAGGATVTARPRGTKDHEGEVTWRAMYVVGADGAHSTVRELVGAAFPGEEVLSSAVLADLRLTDGPLPGSLTLGSTRDGLAFVVPYDRPSEKGGSWYRSMTWDRHHQVGDDEVVAADEIPYVLTRSMGRDLGVAEIGTHSRYHCEERQAVHYRHGRVFLVGDAAHVHSPMGGQGMNTGIQDAVNLAWKLDAVLGGADDAVLDTYQDERHPIGKRVLLQSGIMMRAVTLKPRPARALRNILVPLVLRTRPLAAFIAGSFTGIGLRYPHPRGENRLVGTRAEQVPLASSSLADLQRRGGFVLIREAGAPTLAESSGQDGTDAPILAERTDPGPALLVRPDGYVAWAGSTLSSADEWRGVLTKWVGRVNVGSAQGGAYSSPEIVLSDKIKRLG